MGSLGSAKTVFVVFRGSSDIRNWLSDFDFRLGACALCSGCMTHEGFAAAAAAVYPAVREETTRLLGLLPDHRLVVTGELRDVPSPLTSIGHSLGAALATLTAAQLVHDNLSATLLNFGSPRGEHLAMPSRRPHSY